MANRKRTELNRATTRTTKDTPLQRRPANVNVVITAEATKCGKIVKC